MSELSLLRPQFNSSLRHTWMNEYLSTGFRRRLSSVTQPDRTRGPANKQQAVYSIAWSMKIKDTATGERLLVWSVKDSKLLPALGRQTVSVRPSILFARGLIMERVRCLEVHPWGHFYDDWLFVIPWIRLFTALCAGAGYCCHDYETFLPSSPVLVILLLVPQKWSLLVGIKTSSRDDFLPAARFLAILFHRRCPSLSVPCRSCGLHISRSANYRMRFWDLVYQHHAAPPQMRHSWPHIPVTTMGAKPNMMTQLQDGWTIIYRTSNGRRRQTKR